MSIENPFFLKSTPDGLGDNKRIFEYMASRYIREDEHWGEDLDVITRSIDELLSKKEQSLSYLDIGCGPGFHISEIAKRYRNVQVAGLDYSSRMLAEAQKKIQSENLENVRLISGDVLNLKDEEKYDLITFLNNGFGNVFREGVVPIEIRTEVLRRIYGALDDSGCFLLSVYDREKMPRQYGDNLRIVPEQSDLERGDLCIEYDMAGETCKYYSHWFVVSELRDLLREAGFRENFMERRSSRIIIHAEKT